jgi:predicted ester cyclase
MSELQDRRIQMVKDHMALEIAHDWDAVIDTFEHPRYELYGTGTVFDGEEAVRNYFTGSRVPFPDQGNEIISIAAGDDDVVHVEFWLTGTHLGPLNLGGGRIAEPTGKSFRVRMAATFEFAPGSDRIVCERPYFDGMAIRRELGLD